MYFKRNKGRQGHNPGNGGLGVELLQQVRHKCLRGIIQLEDKGVPFPTTGSGGHAVLHVPSIPHFRLNLKNSSTEVWRCPRIILPLQYIECYGIFPSSRLVVFIKHFAHLFDHSFFLFFGRIPASQCFCFCDFLHVDSFNCIVSFAKIRFYFYYFKSLA